MTNKELTSNEKRNAVILAYKEMFAGQNGDLILEDLEKNFGISALVMPKYKITSGGTEYVPIDPFRTHIGIGKLQVLEYIKRQINRELLDTENENG